MRFVPDQPERARRSQSDASSSQSTRTPQPGAPLALTQHAQPDPECANTVCQTATVAEIVVVLARIIDARDSYTGGHSARVAFLSRLLGSKLDLPPNQLRNVEWAGLLHDVGKVGVPEAILNHPGPLTPVDVAQIRRHTTVGHDILKPVRALRPVLDAIRSHHENFDGSGYPDGLARDAIPLTARIVHIADIFDAITSRRAYRPEVPVQTAIALMTEDAGRTTDPELTRMFFVALRDFARTRPADFQLKLPHLDARDLCQALDQALNLWNTDSDAATASARINQEVAT